MSIAPVYPLPDVETIVVDYLKAHPKVTALVNARNVSGDLPTKPTGPFLTILVVPSPAAVERYLAGPVVQVDAYEDKREKARDLAEIAHAAMIEMVGRQKSGAIVTGVATLLSPGKFPEPSRPRYMFQVRVWAHR